jgi:protein subunit release factor A
LELYEDERAQNSKKSLAVESLEAVVKDAKKKKKKEKKKKRFGDIVEFMLQCCNCHW